MTYVEGFLIPCPAANKAAYIAHAEQMAAVFTDCGATRMVQTWGDDVPDGKLNDLKQAVQATADEAILFSWMEFPDRAARDAAVARSSELPRPAEVPFARDRMIIAGFEMISDIGTGGAPGFIDAVILPVPTDGKQAYLDFAKRIAVPFIEQGATRVADAWGVAVPEGKVTDYHRATLRKADESVVYSWIEWPSRQVRDAGWEKLMKDERLNPGPDRPFDGKRMIFGGFTPIVDTGA